LIRGVLFRPALHDVTVGGLGDVLHGVMPGAVVANGIDGYSITQAMTLHELPRTV
jgi:hypothetical protein